jgi:hypothetical protein
MVVVSEYPHVIWFGGQNCTISDTGKMLSPAGL